MDVAELSNDELVAQVTTWAGRVAAGEAELLRLIGELDAREAWAGHGVRSCAHWLSWKLGLSSSTAWERMRVARALRDLPLTAATFGEGQLSYSQVRAITRIATAATEHRWVELARHSTGSQLDRAATAAARAVAADAGSQDPNARPEKPASQVRWDDDGDLVLTLRIPAHLAPAVLAALEQHQAAEQTEREARLAGLAVEVATCVPAPDSPAGESVLPDPAQYPDPPYPDVERCRPGPALDQAVATWWVEHERLSVLRNAAREQQEQLHAEAAARHLPTGRATLADGLTRALLRPQDGPPVKLQLLIDPVSGWARTRRDDLLAPSTLTALLRTLPGAHRPPRVRPLHAGDLRRHDLGRRARVVSPALRALLGQLDGERCRFPGCDHTTFLKAHHVIFWRHGGRTDLSNLILLCSRHHTLLHEHGYQLVLDPDRTLHVGTEAGTPVRHHLPLPRASAEALPAVAPDTLPSRWGGEPMDLGYVVNVMLQHAA
ncbi:MAG TPA: DUF222 domain-containing protein [Mycobacteriales bacterium]|nr:DUF222 domain-containing protein [Mycobacteriales bacterium]